MVRPTRDKPKGENTNTEVTEKSRRARRRRLLGVFVPSGLFFLVCSLCQAFVLALVWLRILFSIRRRIPTIELDSIVFARAFVKL
jgi:hypothetical protein